jgi:hypothetical protein
LNLSLGDEVNLKVTERLNGNTFRGSNGTELNFFIRARQKQLEIASIVKTWIFRIESDGSFVVSAEEFGRLAVSDRMRPRYSNAVSQGLQCLKEGIVPDKNAISELKGMFNRILREDQWDWFTVWKLFGLPNLAFVENAVAWCVRARGAGDEAADIPRGSWETSDLQNVLQLAAASLGDTPRTISPLGSGKRSLGGTKVPKTGSGTVLSAYSIEKLRAANEAHSHCLQLLTIQLNAFGYKTEANLRIDAFSRLKSGPAVFEVKSIHAENEIDQTRTALGQLYEYRYRESIPTASLWIVYSHKPETEWLVDYLESRRSCSMA